jgi:hypothetical protein
VRVLNSLFYLAAVAALASGCLGRGSRGNEPWPDVVGGRVEAGATAAAAGTWARSDSAAATPAAPQPDSSSRPPRRPDMGTTASTAGRTDAEPASPSPRRPSPLSGAASQPIRPPPVAPVAGDPAATTSLPLEVVIYAPNDWNGREVAFCVNNHRMLVKLTPPATLVRVPAPTSSAVLIGGCVDPPASSGGMGGIMGRINEMNKELRADRDHNAVPKNLVEWHGSAHVEFLLPGMSYNGGGSPTEFGSPGAPSGGVGQWPLVTWSSANGTLDVVVNRTPVGTTTLMRTVKPNETHEVQWVRPDGSIACRRNFSLRLNTRRTYTCTPTTGQVGEQ